ncbi:NAD(P)H-dependent flavin oxidoreductase [Pseudomonas farris]
MSIPTSLQGQLSVPVICAPLFIISNPDLVIAQCKAGLLGSFPALNARPAEELDVWLTTIETELAAARAADPSARIAPYAVNQIVHDSNSRLRHDIDTCVRHRVPVMITSLKAPHEVVEAAHQYGGLVFHDVINARHARKAIEAGVDGLILVASGAGGHAGTLHPFALVAEVREFYDGPIALSGSITQGAQVLSAQAMGADFAYIGTRFIATTEARADAAYKQMLIDSRANDIVYSSLFTGVSGNYLRGSIERSGLDPEKLAAGDKSSMNFDGLAGVGSGTAKAWRDIWGAGQGVGSIRDVVPTAEVGRRLVAEYREALRAAQAFTRDFV